MGDGHYSNAEERVVFVQFVLELIWKSWYILSALICASGINEKTFAGGVVPLFVGWYRYRYNFFMKDIIEKSFWQ